MKFINLLIAATAASLVHARDIKKRSSGFTWFGVSESGAEFGETNIPGKLDKDYTWPNTTAIQTLRDDGMNIFRVPFLMERLVPSEMTGSLDQAYLKGLKKTVAFITGSGAYAVLDPHNYGRYSGNIISSTDNFQAFWKTVAGEFASNNKVIFDTNNEYHDMPQTLVQTLNQAAINGIRASGAKTQPIFIEGNSYTGAWKWTTENDNLKTLTDPSANLVYEMHQYLDSDGSGTAEECVSASIGRERMQKATQWLKTNGKKGFLGEFGGGVNAQCQEAVRGMLQYVQANSDVWMGAEWWAAGPWWGEEYMYNLEPTDGKAYAVYLPILKKFFPSPSPSSSSPSSSGTASAAASTAQVIRSSSSPASSSGTGAGASGSTIPVHVPTTMATSAAASSSSATLVASSSSASLSSSGISSASTPTASSSGGVARRFA